MPRSKINRAKKETDGLKIKNNYNKKPQIKTGSDVRQVENLSRLKICVKH